MVLATLTLALTGRRAASQVTEDDLGLNVALAALDGRVVSPPDNTDTNWRASNLIDGFPIIRGAGAIPASFGWRGSASLPQELVFAFHQNRAATIAAVAIDCGTDGSLEDARVIPKDVEIWASPDEATPGAFKKIAATTLDASPTEQLVRFAPVKARFVKLAILSTHGNAPPQIGEVQIYEVRGPSIVDDVPKDLVLPALGGRLVQFTSQAREGVAAELIDGRVTDTSGWVSAGGPNGGATRLPQEFTFAFRDGRAAFVDRIEIDPTSGTRYYAGKLPYTKPWVKSAEVLVSTASPWEGFEPLATVRMPQTPGPAVVAVHRPVRFVKLRVLETNGGSTTTLGEVRVIEEARPGETSILVGRPGTLGAADARAPGSESATRREREPNDTPVQADRIEPRTSVGGVLSSPSDRDVFVVPAASSTERQALTLDVEGEPAIRARVNVLDRAGRIRTDWDPAQAGGSHARFSLFVDPGDALVQLTQPPGAEVVVWDTSGSMTSRTKDLDAALRAFIDRVGPDDQVNLIRFDEVVEVLLKDFTSDHAVLTAALKGKVFAGGGTAIYDAIAKAAELLRPVAGNRDIILMTDGEDTSSRADPPAFWHALQAAHIRVFTIGLGAGLRSFVARAGTTADRVLSNAADLTRGRFLFASGSNELTAFYQQIADELRAPATYAVSASLSTAIGRLAVKAAGDRIASVAAPDEVELVLDASGSMKRLVGGRSMMDIARQVVGKAVNALPDDARVALRVYGRRVPEGRPDACHDTELLVPFSKIDRPRLLSQIATVKALGTTPIAYAVQTAAADFSKKPGQKMLIVVTDGQEECGGDPEAAAAALRANGLNVTLNIVGFGLTTSKDRDVMSKVAAAAGGRYFAARDGTALDNALDEAMAVEFDVLDGTGQPVAHGVVGGDPIPLLEGVYTVRVQAAGAPVLADHVAVAAGQQATVEVRKQGSEVSARAVDPGSTENTRTRR